MLDRTKSQNQVASWTGKALIAASMLLLGLTLWYARRFINADSLVVTVRLGPLRLIELGKILTDKGYAGSITYLPSLIPYFAFSVIFGALIGLYQSHKT